MAIEAGVDLVLIPHTLETQRAAREAIIKAIKDGRIAESRLDESVARLTELKQRYGLHNRRFADHDALSRRLRTKEHLAIQQEISELSVTMVRNENSVAPLDPKSNQKVLVTGLHNSVPNLGAALQKRSENVTIVELRGERDAVMAAADDAAADADVIVIATCPKEPWKAPTDQVLQADLVKKLHALGKKLIVVAVKEPYDLRNFPEVGTYICTYGYRDAALEAASAAIFGAIKPKGVLPVTIP